MTALLASDVFAGVITPYVLAIEGQRDIFTVRSLDGREAISQSYAFQLVARAATAESHDVERSMLGRQAQLTLAVGERARSFNGVIAAVRVAGRRERDDCDFRIKLVPRLWLLKRKRRTRIFQNQRIVDVVSSVLGEAGIASRWQLSQHYPVRAYCTQYEESDYELVTRLLAESGIYFHFYQGSTGGPAALAAAATAAVTGVAGAVSPSLSALAAAMGPLVAGDSLLLGDDAAYYPALGDASVDAFSVLSAIGSALPIESVADGVVGKVVGAVASLAASAAPPLHFLETEDATVSQLDKVTRFDLGNRVRPTAAMFREYDPDRPLVKHVSAAVSNAPFGDDGLDALASAASGAAAALSGTTVGGVSLDDAVGVATKAVGLLGGPPYLEVYDHHAPMLFPQWRQPSDEAALMLRQERRGASRGRGQSGCPDLAPGRRFSLQGHPIARLDQAYAVTAVRHRGRTFQGAGAVERVYECDFECVPASVTYTPAKPRRRSVQVCLTAIVVGPERSEIHVDEKGQIKVQFHWDRQGDEDDASSCWIRTMQPWAGAGWGVQFIPRVGMEVVVVFEGGDPDKPIVLGSLVNATHPVPFTLPTNKTRSGFRSQTSPGGKGFNELSFDDDRGREQILLQAQRDLDEVIGHNHTLRVENDELIRIIGNRIDTIQRDLTQIVKGNRSSEIGGNKMEAVAGDADERVTGVRSTRVEGKLQHNSRGDATIEAEGDVTLRTLGSVTTVVGLQEKPRSWVTHAQGVASLTGIKRLELASDEELVLRVGKSSLRMTPEKIELASAAVTMKGGGAGVSASDDGLSMTSKGDSQLVVGKKLVIKTEGASLSLGKEAKLDASKILLNSPDKATDPPPSAPEPPTTIALCDDAGAPLAEQRYLITLDDGSQLSGMTGPDGKSELELKAGGEIVFPELTMRGDQPKGAAQPYVVRQGDYLQKLAFKHAFDADKVWNDAKNADLKAKRRDPGQLHPGDILHFADSAKKPFPLSKGTQNDYAASVPTTKVKLVLKDETKPFTGEAYTLEGLPKPISSTVSADGVIEIDAPIHVREVRIVFAKRGLVLPVRVGDLDPIGETSGVRGRLEHLGYLPAAAAALSESDGDARITSAVRAFQRDQGLEPSGEIDDALRAKLEEAHGS